MTPPSAASTLAHDDPDAFARLQQRLPGVWARMQADPDFPSASVVVPSLSFDPEELAKVEGVAFYEERLLFSLMRLRHPRARILYVTSRPIDPDIVDYYLHTLVGVPSSHARARLQLITVQDASTRALTAKLLERPRVLARMRAFVGDPQFGYLTVFQATDLERRLAVALGIPLNGLDPAHLGWGTKSGSRRAFARAGVALPDGAEGLTSREDVVAALCDLATRRPGIRRAVVKLDAGFSGEGNAVFTYPPRLPDDTSARRESISAALHELAYTAPEDDHTRYFRKFEEMGGIVEEFVAAAETRSPSVQMRITPDGELHVLSTHEQMLGGATGQVYLGCRFPAAEEYRLSLIADARKIGEVLRDAGVVSRFAIDFVVVREAGGPWRTFAIEINLRMGGTTAPFQALEYLTGGHHDEATGLFVTPRGGHRNYVATDSLKSPHYRGLLPADLMDIIVRHRLQYDPSLGVGVHFHMIGGLSEFGKVGVTCIGHDNAAALDIFRQTTEVLDAETGATASDGGRPVRLLDHREGRME